MVYLMFCIYPKLNVLNRLGHKIEVVRVEFIIDIVLEDAIRNIQEREVSIKQNLQFSQFIS